MCVCVCVLLYACMSLQRPTARELLRHKFIKNSSRKVSCLVDLIERYRRWKAAGNDNDDDLDDNAVDQSL